MKVSRTIVGTGITTRTRITRQPESMADALELMAGMSVKPYLKYLTDIEVLAKATLQKQGLPSEWGMYRKSGHTWVLCKSGDRAAPQYGLNGLVIDKLRHGIDSPAGYAIRIIQTCRIIRAAFVKVQIETVARYSQQLGEMLSESRLKSRFEAVALKGDRAAKGSRLAANLRRAKYASRNRGLAQKCKEFMAAHPAISTKEAMIRVGREFGLKPEAARKAIRAGLKEIG